MSTSKLGVVLLAGLLCGALGCGYSMRSSLDPKYRSIYVAAFENQSREYDLQAPLTNAVRRKFRPVAGQCRSLPVDGPFLRH